MAWHPRYDFSALNTKMSFAHPAGAFQHPSTQTMTTPPINKALRFHELHQRPGTFLIPNPWDAGSARILAGLGFEAFATSSAAAAGVLGRRDGRISREEALAHYRVIANATDLPVA